MSLLGQPFILFVLNILDAILTIYWVRNGFASEGNQLMAHLLDMGVLPFLLVKIAVGGVAAIVLWRWGNLPLARYGMTVTLAIYISLMGIHFFTGLFAFGYISDNFISNVSHLTNSFLAFFF